MRKLVWFALFGFGGLGGVGAYFKAWDRYAPPALQSMLGFGALASPEKLAREPIPSAVGKQVKWRGKVIEVHRPLVGGHPWLLVRSGETVAKVIFHDSLDDRLKALSKNAEVDFEGTLTKVPPEQITVEGASFAGR